MSTSPRKRPASEAIIAGGVVVLLIAIVGLVLWSPMGRALYPPEPVTEEARLISNLYDIVFALAVVIFIAVEGLIVWSILRYRRRPGDVDLPPQTHGNNLVEVIWTVVPTAIVLFLFVISWNTLNTVDAVSTSPDIRIHAVAGQFAWQFEYLDESGKVVLARQLVPTYDAETGAGGMAVPVGRSIQVTLDSPDVIHAFYVPQFLFKRDVVPGRTNQFDFTVNESDVGQTFRGQCAELCGSGHSIMLFEVKALSAADFDAWLAEKSKPAPSAPPAPSGQPGPSGQPAPSGGAAGETLTLVAKDIKFDQTSLTAAAATPFNIDFKNQDPATPHNVAVHQGSPTGQEVFKGEIFPGVAEKVYVVPALPAGPYAFVCTVHPNMTGTLTVQ
jgi:cytochrome c oxidase subunit 2